jgi:hypothetical protein
VDVMRGGVTERVRLIGIDTPEHAQCGFTEATSSLAALVGGRTVDLVPGARTDRDAYGRLLRYVDVAGVDSGLRQLQAGLAVARYDSRDGYGAHPREEAYHAADAASAAGPCTAAPKPVVTPPTKPANPAPAATASAWPLAGDRFPCPQARPVKGNASSMKAHSPGQQSYLVTSPEACFATIGDAVAAGYTAAKR